MPFHPNQRQALALFGVLFAQTPVEREPMRSKLKPRLSPNEQRELVKAGLLEQEQRGRATHVRATDAAWEWAGTHLDVKLSKSSSAAPVLENLLSALQKFLPANDLALAHVFLPAQRNSAELASSGSSAVGVSERIRDAIYDIGGGSTHQRVRLSDLRARLEDLPRERLDKELLEMQARRRLVLYRLDNPAELTAADRRAALLIAGNPRHLVYLEA